MQAGNNWVQTSSTHLFPASRNVEMTVKRRLLPKQQLNGLPMRSPRDIREYETRTGRSQAGSLHRQVPR